MKKKKHLILKILLPVLTISIVVFIFFNSSQIASVSGERSKLVLEFINKLISFTGIILSEHFIRKLAHFTEYAALGFFMCLSFRVYTVKISRCLIFSSLLGLLTAMADEYYQTFIPGRAGLVKDVFIDFSGLIVGIIISLIIVYIINLVIEHRNWKRHKIIHIDSHF